MAVLANALVYYKVKYVFFVKIVKHGAYQLANYKVLSGI